MLLKGKPYKKELVSFFQEKKILNSAKVGIIPNPYDEASAVYFKQIIKTFKKFDIEIEEKILKENASKEDYLKTIDKWNNDNTIDAIFIQVPLINNLNKENILMTLNPDKDLEGVHKYNLANLLYKDETIVPPTARAIIDLAEYYKIDFTGKNVTIINRSYIIGKPLIPLLLNRNATPTICHSKTNNIQTILENSDIIISAIGKPHFITKNDDLKNKIILDASINFEDGKLIGDSNYKDLNDTISITPVPGGIGPITNLMLIKNLYNILNRKNSN